MQLGAQRNDLFGEMQELLKQQQDEVAACRAALALGQQNAAAVAGSSGTIHQRSTTRLRPTVPDIVCTVVRVQLWWQGVLHRNPKAPVTAAQVRYTVQCIYGTSPEDSIQYNRYGTLHRQYSYNPAHYLAMTSYSLGFDCYCLLYVGV